MATINERLMDFQTAQSIRWIRLSNREAREALKILSRVDMKLKSLLLDVDPISAPFSKARLDALKVQVTNLLEDIHKRQLSPALFETVSETAVLAGEVEERAFARVLPAGLDVITPNLGVLQNAALIKPFNGAILGEWIDAVYRSDLDRTWRAIVDGIEMGTTTDDLIRQIMGTPSLRYKDGVRQVTRRGVEALVRTSITHATNVGRQQVWEDNSDLISSVRWVSTLDGRTTPVCRHNDGRVGPVSFDKDFKPPEGSLALEPLMARPPAHPNCRSTTVSVVKSWKELGFDVDDLDPSTRAAMDGQVPEDTTYYEWLTKQSASFQEDVLGKTRYKLWKEKGVKPERFTNDEGRLYTLDELRQKMPNVFKDL